MNADPRLDAVRSLLLRQHLVRAASAPAALVAGTLSLVNAALTVHWLTGNTDRLVPIQAFVLSWVGVLLVSAIAGLLFLWRAHRGHVEPPDPHAFRLVLRALAPPAAAAAASSVLFHWNGAAYSMAVAWILFYGLALLATTPFAPRPIVILGSAFLITAASLMVFVHLRLVALIGYSRSDIHTALLMAFTFGGFHLAYAAVLWIRPAHPSSGKGQTHG